MAGQTRHGAVAGPVSAHQDSASRDTPTPPLAVARLCPGRAQTARELHPLLSSPLLFVERCTHWCTRQCHGVHLTGHRKLNELTAQFEVSMHHQRERETRSKRQAEQKTTFRPPLITIGASDALAAPSGRLEASPFLCSTTSAAARISVLVRGAPRSPHPPPAHRNRTNPRVSARADDVLELQTHSRRR